MRIQAQSHKKNRRQEAQERNKRLSMILAVFGIAMVVVLVGGAALGLVTLVKYFKEPEAVFEAVPKKQIKIPPKTPQHKMNVAKHEASRPKPTFTQKLMSTKPTDFALPDLPQVDLDQMLPLDPSELVTDQVASLMGTSGIGNGLGNGMTGGGGSGSGTNFMGLQAQGSKVLLIFDISTSVVNAVEASGTPFDSLKDETIQVIESLNPNMRFGMIQFSRAFRPYPGKELMVATKGKKDEAIQWLEDNWLRNSVSRSLSGSVTRGDDGVIEVLKYAFEMDPEIIYMISDASFQDNTNRTVPHDEIADLFRELQPTATARGGIKFNFLGFGIRSDNAATMKKITRRNGGELKILSEKK